MLIKLDTHVLQDDWANIEIRFKYEKIKFHDLFNRSMERVLQKIQKWDIKRPHKFGEFALPKFGV